MADLLLSFKKQEFLDRIASGQTDGQALSDMNFPQASYILLISKNAEFREMVENAKKVRADKWFEEIIKSSNNPSLSKEDVPVEKLKFEQRKYLAAIDNPDKYGERVKHQHDVTLNIFTEMKNMSSSEARQILSSADPFNDIETTSTKLPPEETIDTPKPRRRLKLDERSDEWQKYDTTEPMTEEDESTDDGDIFS